MKRKSYADIAIITALPEEVLAAISILDDQRFEIYKSNGNTYLYGYITPPSSSKGYSVVVSISDFYGGFSAASITVDIFNKWNPEIFILLGIAAGNPRKVNLGDVVMADEVFEVFFQKFIRDDAKNRPQELSMLPALVNQCGKYGNADWQKLISEERPSNRRKNPKFHKGLIISTNSVFGSDKSRDSLIKDKPQVLAIEMEASGVISALNAMHIKPRPCIVIKGISDYGGDNKADNPWRKYAAQVAAAYVKFVLFQKPIPLTNHQATFPRGTYKASLAEKYNWLGNIKAMQGKFREAENNFKDAWIKVDEEKNGNRRLDLISRITLNLGYIKRIRGTVAEAHRYSKISMILSSRNKDGIALANSYFTMGLITREYGEMKLAIRYFKKAYDEYENQGNHIGQTSAERWHGYALYSLGNYEESYKHIYSSHEKLIEHVASYMRCAEGAESFDILGRVLRQLSIKYKSDPRGYQSLRKVKGFLTLPKSLKECQKEALRNYDFGKKIAIDIGDQYRVVESYLSYVIFYFEYPDLDFYKEKKWGIRSWTELKEYFKKGVKIAKDNEYFLLLCIYEKYMGNAFFQKRRYKIAFEHYANRYLYSKKVRPIEQDNTLEEMTTQLLALSRNSDRKRCLSIFRDYLLDNNIDSSAITCTSPTHG